MTADLVHQAAMDRPLGAAGLGVEHVGGIADQRMDALVADRAQRLLAGRFADDRIVVQLPVAGVEDAAVRRIDQQRIALGDRMRERDVADLEGIEIDRALLLDLDQLDVLRQPGFLQLAANQFGGERRGVERHVEGIGEVRDRADVVLVRVRDDDADEVVGALLDEIEIGEDEVDAGIFPAREGHAKIDHQPLAVGTRTG